MLVVPNDRFVIVVLQFCEISEGGQRLIGVRIVLPGGSGGLASGLQGIRQVKAGVLAAW